MPEVLNASSERRDVARFLAEHEEHGSDFEIGRAPGGGGRLRLTCRGCGENAVYSVDEPGVLALADQPPLRKRERRRMTREEIEVWLPAPAALPWWIPNAYIMVVIGVGVALIAAGLVARESSDPVYLGGNGGQTTTPAPPAPAPAPTAPAPAPEPSSSEGDRDDNVGDKGGGKGRNKTPEPDLNSVTVLGRFVIGVPPGWARGLSGGAVVFHPPSQAAQVRVFLEPGDEGPRTLSRQAADFLEGEHPSAKISRPERFRLGDVPAVRVVASWDDGTEWAALVSESGYSYLLLSRVDKDAPSSTKAQAVAALNSFNPL